MESHEIDSIIAKQREFFKTGITLPVNFRLQALKNLKQNIKQREADILAALKSDLGKSSYEAYMCEVGLVLSEISYMLKHTKKFAKEHRVKTPLSQFASRSYKKPSPYGTVLVMSPWNYPFLLTMDPLIDAIAAGNTAVVKPSAYSPATSQIIKELIEDSFVPGHVAVVTGGRKENATLLEKKFDFVFFTGSQAVGKEVLHKVADNLTPVVLELGGKSPCIIHESAKLALAAKRVVFGKFINCGQTCVAPDYILCHSSVKEQFVKELVTQLELQYGKNPLDNPDYGKIINQKHFERVFGLIDPKKVVVGGTKYDATQQIAPTIMDNVTVDDAVMQEEIFGPILPILTYDNIDEVVATLHDKEKPLAFYIFAQDKKIIKKLTTACSFGGGCVNDTIIHLATSELGFGGVGESGMGSYHGKEGFDVFSHSKSIVDKKTWIDLPMRYQPYKSKTYRKLIRMFLK